MLKAKFGDKVKIHYTGSTKDGTVVNSTLKESPMIFTIGEEIEIRGIEKAVMGMKEGEVKFIQIPPEDAYGEHRKSLVSVVGRDKVSGNIDLKPGMKLKARTSTGIMKDVTVCDISDTSVTVDANHPLAGRELTFEIRLLEIMK